MNRFYDYLIVRIYRWYESFENEPSLFTAKLLVAFHQTFIVIIVFDLITNHFSLTPNIDKIIAIIISLLLFIRLHLRYSNKNLFQTLLQTWTREQRTMKIIKGIMIPIIIVLPSIIYVIVGRLALTQKVKFELIICLDKLDVKD